MSNTRPRVLYYFYIIMAKSNLLLLLCLTRSCREFNFIHYLIFKIIQILAKKRISTMAGSYNVYIIEEVIEIESIDKSEIIRASYKTTRYTCHR